MADDFGLKIGIEGEREFRAALKDINQQFKVLGSEMKLVESQFNKQDRSVSALTARNEVLTRQITEQKEKIELLRKALENSAESFGENDQRTQQWTVQLNNAQAQLNNMERELKDKQYKYGFADLMAHDCSGFLSWLMRETGIWDDRKNCDGLWALCEVVARNELIAGDFLFRNSTTNANDETHVGLYLGRGMVIHAKGRDVGVVVEGINQGGSGYWHKCGRCKLLRK